MNRRTLWAWVGVVSLGVLAGCGDEPVSEGCPDGSWVTGGDAGSACLVWTTCAAGQYETAPGTATSDRQCAPCAPGSLEPGCGGSADCVPGQYLDTAGSSGPRCMSCPTGTFTTETNASYCPFWRNCPAGSYVVAEATATSNRVCEECPPLTYTSGPNQAMCISAGQCPAGTALTRPPTPSSPAVCTPCIAGQQCLGATLPAMACIGELWDHDSDPATTCVPRRSCSPGSFVVSYGDATHDRVCEPCSSGYSTTTNALSCTSWTVCGGGTYVSASGTSRADRTCTDCPSGTFNPAFSNVSMCTPWSECGFDEAEYMPGTALRNRLCVAAGWTRQFGTSAADEALAVFAGPSTIALGGRTSGALPQQTFNGGWDAFVQLYDKATGAVLWTRQFGAASDDQVSSVSVGGGGDVAVTGHAGLAASGGPVHFLRQYGSDGSLDWSHNMSWLTAAVTTASDGSVYVAGRVFGTLPGQSSVDAADAVVQKYSASGSLLWTRQFGTSLPDRVLAASAGSDGGVVVAGLTYGAFPGETILGEEDVFVRKYDADGVVLWTRQFGTSMDEWGPSVSVGSDGVVAVAATTYGVLPGQTGTGSVSAFVRTYDASGVLLWTRQFGGNAGVVGYGVSIANTGRVLVAGRAESSLLGQTEDGFQDAFLVTYDPAGTLLRTRLFGTAEMGQSGADAALAVSSSSTGHTFLVGQVRYALPGSTELGGGDAFLRAIYTP